jgi:hypothetical protein
VSECEREASKGRRPTKAVEPLDDDDDDDDDDDNNNNNNNNSDNNNCTSKAEFIPYIIINEKAI